MPYIFLVNTNTEKRKPDTEEQHFEAAGAMSKRRFELEAVIYGIETVEEM